MRLSMIDPVTVSSQRCSIITAALPEHRRRLWTGTLSTIINMGYGGFDGR
jgi:hypothetical protein